MSEQITFRPLTRADFADMIRWHKAPHAGRWFSDSPTDIHAAEAEYGACIDGTSPTKMHVVEIDEKAVGYMQHYLVRDYPDYLAAVNDDAAAAVDFLIGEGAYIGRGLGPRILRQYIDEIVRRAHPDIARVVSSPDPHNARSIRALEKAGFHQGSTIKLNGVDERLCILDLR